MTTPLCSYFRTCGGCNLQHIDYALQLEKKRRQVERLLGVETVEVFSGPEYFYRNRIDFVWGRQGLGMRSAQKSTMIVPVERCVIGSAGINQLTQEVNQFFNHIDLREWQAIKGCVIRESRKGESSITFEIDDDSKFVARGFEKIRAFCEHTNAQSVLVKVGDKEEDVEAVKGTEFLSEVLCGKEFHYSSLWFFQNNPIVAEKMLMYSREILSSYETKKGQLLDLYGGVGTLGIVNADLFGEVLIVENSKSSIAAAKKNIEANKTNNVEAFALDATQIERLKLKKPLFVICDPPRSGMAPKVITILNSLKPDM